MAKTQQKPTKTQQKLTKNTKKSNVFVFVHLSCFLYIFF